MSKLTSVSSLAKLTPEQVREIRKMLRRSVSQRDVADAFRISQSTVSNIANRKVYARVA